MRADQDLIESTKKSRSSAKTTFNKSIQLAALPYKLNALAPYISEETLKLHYHKHNKKYVDTLNTLKNGTIYDNLNLEEIIFKASIRSIDVTDVTDINIFNSASQVWNHAFYWQCLSPKHNLKPSEGFIELLSKTFESFKNFTRQFTAAGLDQFGSGWVWLVRNNSQNLEIVCTSNADTPLIRGQVPLLLCDVWEHAYYLDYKNDRKAYLENFWELVNWQFVESCMASTASPKKT